MDDRVRSELQRAPRRRPGRRRLAIALAFATSALVLVAATTTLLGIYESVPGDAYRLSWDRGQVLGLAQTRDGYRVTLERAYADAGTVMLAVSVVDTEGRGHSQVGRGDGGTALGGRRGVACVRDVIPAGRSRGREHLVVLALRRAREGVATGDGDRRLGVGARRRDPASGGRRRPVEPVARDRRPVDLRLRPCGGGRRGASSPTSSPITSAGITLDLESIVISPTVARAAFSIDGASADEYALIGTVRHDGKVLEDGSGVVAAGSLQLTTGTGVDDSSGEWVVTVTELAGMSDRPTGPWTFRFSVP